MRSMGRRHAAKEVQHEDGHKLSQHGADEALLLGRELVEAQAVFEQFPHVYFGSFASLLVVVVCKKEEE